MNEQPLVAIAYERWRDLPYKQVLDEMAVLFHLAVRRDDVRALEILQTRLLAERSE